jgi:hypothetical protein
VNLTLGPSYREAWGSQVFFVPIRKAVEPQQPAPWAWRPVGRWLVPERNTSPAKSWPINLQPSQYKWNINGRKERKRKIIREEGVAMRLLVTRVHPGERRAEPSGVFQRH